MELFALFYFPNGSVLLLVLPDAGRTTFKCKHTNRSRARSRARDEVSEGYWGSNIFSFQCVSIALLRRALIVPKAKCS